MNNPSLPWQEIHHVLLDMDGTLLDRHFDDTFFLETVPHFYAQRHAISLEEARHRTMEAYMQNQGTLEWYDLDYWSRKLELDIPLLKEHVAHLIQVRPTVLPFLQALREGPWRVHLVTNAHAQSLALKMSRTPIGNYFDSITSSHELGRAKEDPLFWPLLQDHINFDPPHTLLVDDSEPVLTAAAAFGLGYLVHMAAPSSSLPPVYSQHFPSTSDFSCLMPVTKGG
ncbi:MAG: GMP/IMP nucleotidase [Magnetococcales bacterium]|nr:GMP/IMP nucleotidase [Magnetococcales bacterium]NGZ27032.1 GMP/IMP nucleotidase [Magnetococcales bacterium]